MPANKRFSADQVEGLTVYLRALASGAAQTTAVCAAPSNSLENLYARHCASCHGRDGTGSGVVGRSLKIPDLTSPAVQTASDEELATVITTGRGKMRGYGSILIPEQITELVAYMRAFKPTGVQAKTAASMETHSTAVAALASPPASHKSPEPETPAPKAAASTPPATSAASAKSQQSGQSATPGASEARMSAPPATGSVQKAKPTATPTYTPPKRPPDVHQTYARKCSSCHSRDGSGSGIVGRQMRIRSFSSPEVKAASDEQLAAVIASGRGKMPAFGKKLSSEQIMQVVDYIRKLSETTK
jgi:mono/diheme cytochrome c family protein